MGIGTTSPASPLHIQADGIGLRFDGSSNTTKSIFYRNTSASNPAQILTDGSLRLFTEDSGTDIRFHVNSDGSSNEKMRINSTGVGIGTAGPSKLLHVVDGEGTVPTIGAGGVAIVQNNDNTGDNCRLTILAGAAASSMIEFGDASDADVGQVEYSHNENKMNFRVNGGTKMSLDSSGDVGISGDITANGGVAQFGVADTTPGLLYLYGGATGGEGGEMRIYNNADDDSTYDYWRVDSDGSGNFRIGRAGTTDFSMNLSGQITDMPQLAQKLDITVAGTSNSSTGLEINSTGTNFESDTGMIEVTHAGSGTPTGGFFCKFNHGGSTKFSVKGTGLVDSVGVNTGDLNVQTSSGGGGDADIEGTLSKGSGSFKISHPLDDKKDTHHLVHSFIEGPQADLIYRGKVALVSGSATINIDTHSTMTEGTFVVLCRDIQSFTTNETGWTAVKSSVSGNILTIQAQDSSCTDTISWMVVGERQDPTIYSSSMTDDEGRVIVEKLKVENSP